MERTQIMNILTFIKTHSFFIKKSLICLFFCSVTLFSVSSFGNKDSSTTELALQPQSSEQITITFSCWGNDAGNKAVLKALKKFEEKNPDIRVECTYGSWTGWETYMLQSLSSNEYYDINQINWNWLDSFSSETNPFLDLCSVSDYIDLTSFPKSILDTYKINNALYTLPISLSNYNFYWNKHTFKRANLSVPKSLEDLLQAGSIFSETLGDDFYPLILTEQDRMYFLVYYLQSMYGKPWIENGAILYTADEIKTYLDFLQLLESNHVIPDLETLNNTTSPYLVKSFEWQNGMYAGIFKSDMEMFSYESALKKKKSLVPGTHLAGLGSYYGGFTRMNYGLSISKKTKYPEACAKLIQFLLNDIDGIEQIGLQKGIPFSEIGMKELQRKKILSKTDVETYNTLLTQSSYLLDNGFDSYITKYDSTIYKSILNEFSLGNYSSKQAATLLLSELSKFSNH